MSVCQDPFAALRARPQSEQPYKLLSWRPNSALKKSLWGQVAALSVLTSRRTLRSSALRFGLLADFFNALLRGRCFERWPGIRRRSSNRYAQAGFVPPSEP